MAAAANAHIPLWKYIAKIGDIKKCGLPVPLVSLFECRPMFDIMVAPIGATSELEALKMVHEL